MSATAYREPTNVQLADALQACRRVEAHNVNGVFHARVVTLAELRSQRYNWISTYETRLRDDIDQYLKGCLL